jgi:signal transduction histidine kinase/ActR/RegA family two-component response regulator
MPTPDARRRRQQLSRLMVTPFVTIGVLSALLVWEIEHIGSIALTIVVAVAAIGVAALVTRRVGRRVRELSDYYERLLESADEASRRAEAANRLKDEFLSTLSHELRTPLNSVLGWSRLLATGKLDANQTVNAIRAIERAGWAQSRLIEDLLDISRVITGRLRITTQPTLLRPVIDRTVQSLSVAAHAKKITVSAHVDPAVGAIDADPDRLQQIVWNLLSNALTFTGPGGRVFLQVDRDDHFVRLCVTDTGIGFDSETAAHMFERFRQGDGSSTRQYGGLGMGLALVRHLVELHGGTVSASSQGPDRGSRFEVRLPIGVGATDAASPPEETAMPSVPFLAGVSVLVVDDNPMELDFVRTSLEQYGAEVVTAASAGEARTRFELEPPDVLVSDLRMPEKDGWQLIREVREIDARSGRHTPAAALSALARAEDRRQTEAAGYQLHMSKPVDPFELASAVARLSKSADGSKK